MRALGGIWLVALVAWAPAPVSADPVIPPGHEQTFATLLESPLPGGWTIEAIRIEGVAVHYQLRAGDARARIRLAHPGDVQPGPRRTVVGGFFVSAEALAGEGDLDAAYAAVVERLKRGDVPAVWADAIPRATGPDETGDTGRWQGEDRETPRTSIYGALATAVALLFALWGWRARDRTGWPFVVAGLALALVVGWAWAADDAFISFRYLHNATHGHGLVFNRGERVQGFTHPAWVLLLLGPSAILGPFDAAMVLSIGLTALTLVLLLGLARRLHLGPAAQVGLLVALFTSESFVAFQTSGLENAASHLAIVGLADAALRISRGQPGARRLFLFAGLALLTRLDLVWVVGPLLLGAARDRGPRELTRQGRLGLVVAALGLGAWLVFATLYYGFPLPNTFYAKTGEPLTWARGVRYLVDFLLHEPLAASLGAAGLLATLRGRLESHAEERWLRRVGLGAVLTLAYVVAIGGDYMRGRFLVLPFLLSQIGLFTVLGRGVWARRALAPLVALGLVAFVFGSRAHAGAIVNERAYHPESLVWNVGDGHVRPNRRSVELGPEPTLGATVMARAFTDDPRLRWVDGHGLTDPFVARCPALPGGRAGHAPRRVPLAYYQARGDARLLEDGEARLLRGDASVSREAAALRARAAWPDPALERRHRELRLLTAAPIFDSDRLALIPRYLFGRSSIPVGDDVPTYQPPP